MRGDCRVRVRSHGGRGHFSEVFARDGDLTTMLNDPDIMRGGKVDQALKNAESFAEAAYERL